MLIRRSTNILIPSQELGALIAQEDAETQKNIFVGFSEELSKKLLHNNQAVISLVHILPVSVLIMIAELYEEAHKNGYYQTGSAVSPQGV